jgi:hypothetical protein
VNKLGTAWLRQLFPKKCSSVREEEARTMIHVLQGLTIRRTSIGGVSQRCGNFGFIYIAEKQSEMMLM